MGVSEPVTHNGVVNDEVVMAWQPQSLRWEDIDAMPIIKRFSLSKKGYKVKQM